MMRIAVDLDGVICQLKKPNESYGELEPMPGAIERIRKLKSAGHSIIILTARNMETCQSNVGRVMKNVGRLTLEWLDRMGIEYDEIYFGKPNAELYLDDRAMRFNAWDEITDEVIEKIARLR
jgi:capsule biosynthesis phosphatase